MLGWIKSRLWPTLRETYERWREDDGFLLSAAMSYYAALSLFPLTLVLIAGLGLFLRFSALGQDAETQLLAVVGQNFGEGFSQQFAAIIAGVREQARIGGPVGLLVLLAAAIGIFVQFDGMFDRIWKVEKKAKKGLRSVLKRVLVERLTAFLIMLGIGALIVAVLLLNVALSAVRGYVVDFPGGRLAWQAGQLALSVSINALLFGAMYKFLPQPYVRWRHALAGGAAVAVVWLLGQYVLGTYLIGEKYSAYGVVGSFLAVMLFIYYASATVFLGAEFVQSLSEPLAARR